MEFFNLMSFLLSLCIHQRKTLSKRPFDFDAWFLPHVLPMGRTNGKVQRSINKRQDFWGCTVLQWPPIWRWEYTWFLICHFSTTSRCTQMFSTTSRCMQMFLFSNPNSFQLHVSARKIYSTASQLSLPHCCDLLSPLVCCSPLPQMPSYWSQSSFACQFLSLFPGHKFPCNSAAGRELPWNDLLLGKFWLQRGGNQAKLLWNLSQHLGVGNPTNPFATPLK